MCFSKLYIYIQKIIYLKKFFLFIKSIYMMNFYILTIYLQK